MSPLFWLDSAAFGISTMIAAALALTVLGVGSRLAINLLFAAFAVAEATWAVSSLLLRMTLWLHRGDPALILELCTLAFALMGPFLLMFTVRYIGHRTRGFDLVAVLGLVTTTAFSIPLFRDQLIFNPYLGRNDIPRYDISPLGFVAALLPALYLALSLVLFWQRRRQTREPYLAASVLLLLAGFSVGGLFNPPFPMMSITTTFSIAILGYGILHQQLLNPLRELTTELEHKVEERTQELAQVAARLETTNLALARRNAQFEAAAHVAREATAIRDVGQLLRETVHLISERFGFYHAGIFLLDEAGEYMVLQAASSEGGQQMLARKHRLEVGKVGVVGHAAGAGEPRIALNVGADAHYFDNPDLPDTRSEMALPLKVREHVIGVLDVQSTKEAAFSEEDVAILQTLADQLAVAIENSHLLEEAQDQLREIETLLGHQGRAGWQQLAAERPHLGYVYDGVKVLPRDVTSAAARPESASVTEHQVTVPLQVRGEAIGHLDLELADRPFTSSEVALIRAVAEQAGLALENARLFQETQKTLGEVERLYHISRAIGAAASAEEVGQALMDYAADSNVDVARLLLFEYDERGQLAYLVMREGWTVDDRPVQLYGTRLSMEDYALADLLDPQQPIIVKDVLSDPKANEATRILITDVSGMRSFAMVPISIGERWIGMIFLGRDEPSIFAEELIRSYGTLAGQAAVALEGLRLLEATQYRAERERLVTEIATRVRASTEVDTILSTAIRELGQALRASDGLIRLEIGNGASSSSSKE